MIIIIYLLDGYCVQRTTHTLFNLILMTSLREGLLVQFWREVNEAQDHPAGK